MTKKATEAPREFYILGRDLDEKPRGGRFDSPHIDRIASVALDLGLAVVVEASPEFAALAKKLPPGRLYTSGKAFIPNIKADLLTQLLGVLRKPGDSSQAYRLEQRPKKPGQAEPAPPILLKSPVTSGLPRDWDSIEEGHLVIAEASYEDGFWAAIVEKREGDILTLRYRDSPTMQIVRHVTTVAILNPGPLASKS